MLAISNLNQLVTGTRYQSRPGGSGGCEAAAETGKRLPAEAARQEKQPQQHRKAADDRGGAAMKLADVSIRRPVFAIMMSLALVTLGVFSYKDLGVDLMPKTDQPTVNVNVRLPGASAEEVESQITKPIEEAVNSIAASTSFERLRTRASPTPTSRSTWKSRSMSPFRTFATRSARSCERFPNDAGPPSSRKRIPIPRRF